MFAHLVAVAVFFFIVWEKVSEKTLFAFFRNPTSLGLIKQRVACGPRGLIYVEGTTEPPSL